MMTKRQKRDKDKKGHGFIALSVPKPLLSLAGGDADLLRLFFILVFILIAAGLALPDTFLSFRTFQAMSIQFPEIGILAIGMMLTMLTGGIDLSVVSTANLAAVCVSLTLTTMITPGATSPYVVPIIILALIVALVVGVLAGLINGLLITRIGITPILATLGTMTLYAGFSTVITKGTSFFAVPSFLVIGFGDVLGLPVPLLIFIVSAAVVSLILNRRVFGYTLYMLGTNPTAARFAGINNARILLKTYMLSGLFAGIAGIIFLARNNAAKADYGESYVLLVVLVAILGGVNYVGGFGKISGLVMAVVALQILSTGLNMLLFEFSGSNFFKEFAWGVVLLLVMVMNYISKKRESG